MTEIILSYDIYPLSHVNWIKTGMTLGIWILPNMAQPQKHPVPYLEEIWGDQVLGKVSED